MDELPKQRKARGPSPRGDLTVSKRVATTMIDEEREARVKKTATLRAKRLERHGLAERGNSTEA